MDSNQLQKATQGISVSQQEQSSLPDHLRPIAGILQPEESKILKLKYIVRRISETPAIDIGRHAKGLLFRLHTITGWKLPDDEYFLNTLVSEFTQYLVEKCGDLNPEEIAHAFRNHSLEVKDWGKSMNLSLIDEPIREYRIKRRELSELEERLSNQQEWANAGELPPAQCDWSEEWTQLKEKAKNGQIRNAVIITPIYDWLVREGILKLSNEEKWELIRLCKDQYLVQVKNDLNEMAGSTEAKSAEGNRLREVVNKMNNADWKKDVDIMARLITLSKVQAVRELAMTESI